MRAIAAILMLSVFITGSAPSADEPKPKQNAKRDKKATELLKQTADLFKDVKSLHVEVEAASTIQDGEDKREIQAQCTYDLERPNRLAVRCRLAKEKDAGFDLVSDGKTLTTHALRFKQYIESPAPKEMAELGQRLQRFGHMNTGFIFQNVLAEDPYDTLIDDVMACSYAGKEKVGGLETHHLKFTQPELKWEVWIAAEGKPLIVKAESSQAVDERRARTVETYKNWKLDTAAEKNAFRITLPKEATKVDAFRPPKQ